MKITGPGPLAPSSVRPGRRARGDTGARFAGEIAEETPPTGQVAAGAPLSTVEGLLSVQEVDDPTAGRTRAPAYGHDLLDRLDEIHHPPLFGAIPRHRLLALQREVRRKRVAVADPRLGELLDEIDLRAAVEPAKLGIIP